MFYYHCHHLTIASPLSLPLLPAQASSAVTLEIRFGKVKADVSALTPHGAGLHYSADTVIFTALAAVRYEINKSGTITIEYLCDVDEQTVRHFLMTSAIPYFLSLQNKTLVMRGSAFTVDGNTAQLLVGAPGSGKSTLLAVLCGDRGKNIKMLTDHICVITFDENYCPFVQPYFPFIQLVPETALGLNLPEQSCTPVRPGAIRQLWQVPAEKYHAAPLRVMQIFTLHSNNTSSPLHRGIEEVTAKMRELMPYQFAKALMPVAQSRKLHLQLAHNVIVDQLTRQNSITLTDELVRAMYASMGLVVKETIDA